VRSARRAYKNSCNFTRIGKARVKQKHFRGAMRSFIILCIALDLQDSRFPHSPSKGIDSKANRKRPNNLGTRVWSDSAIRVRPPLDVSVVLREAFA
jgi:hypothetical protein